MVRNRRGAFPAVCALVFRSERNGTARSPEAMLKNCLRLRAPLTSTYLRPTAEHGKGHVLSREFGDTGKTGPRSVGDTLFGCTTEVWPPHDQTVLFIIGLAHFA